MPKKYYVSPFRRKGGVKVKGFYRKKPKLSAAERERRAKVAKEKLLPAAVKWAGKKGFRATREALEGKEGITNPTLLAGWLKGQAKEKGELSPKHLYVGRKGYRKYKIGGRKVKASVYYKKYGRPGERKKRVKRYTK